MSTHLISSSCSSLSSYPRCCANSLSLGRVYEEHVLATGSLDERVFTGEGASEDVGTPGPCLCEPPGNQDSATNRLHASLTVREHCAQYFWPTGPPPLLLFLLASNYSSSDPSSFLYSLFPSFSSPTPHPLFFPSLILPILSPSSYSPFFCVCLSSFHLSFHFLFLILFFFSSLFLHSFFSLPSSPLFSPSFLPYFFTFLPPLSALFSPFLLPHPSLFVNFIPSSSFILLPSLALSSPLAPPFPSTSYSIPSPSSPSLPFPVCSYSSLSQASALKVSTPLTGRKYIQNGVTASPLSSAMKSVGRLHTLLSGTQQEPSTRLKEVLRYDGGAVKLMSLNLATFCFLTLVLTHQRSNFSLQHCCSLRSPAGPVPETLVMSSPCACRTCSRFSLSTSRAARPRTEGWGKVGACMHMNTHSPSI